MTIAPRLILPLASLLIGGSAMAAGPGAEDGQHHLSKRTYEPAPPLDISYRGARTKAKERPCPSSQVEWPAVRRSHYVGAAPRRSQRARFSPSYCAHIASNGRVLSHYLALGSGDEAVDRRLLRDIGGLRFFAAQSGGRLVTAWHRILVRLDDLPEGLTGAVHRGPELTLVR